MLDNVSFPVQCSTNAQALYIERSLPDREMLQGFVRTEVIGNDIIVTSDAHTAKIVCMWFCGFRDALEAHGIYDYTTE